MKVKLIKISASFPIMKCVWHEKTMRIRVERKNPPISEPCILHLDLFIEELKRHPLLHDAAFTAPQARKVDVTERLAMP